MQLNEQQQNTLLSLAKQSILTGVQADSIESGTLQELIQSTVTKLTAEDKLLTEAAATFVTLHKNRQLRGCIGTLQAHRPLAEDVMHNAYQAAFRDPRFEAVTEDELAELNVEISVLTKPEPMPNQAELALFLQQLEAGRDGLILTEGYHRATFLPSVWEQLPDKKQFVQHLMFKAGIACWSENIQCQRYYSNAFDREWGDIPALTKS